MSETENNNQTQNANPAMPEPTIFVSYNVLSSRYCDARSYPQMSLAAVDPERRWQLVRTMLGKFFDQGAVVLLQEVPTQGGESRYTPESPHDWIPRLFELAKDFDYQMFESRYGHPSSGSMALVTLVPAGIAVAGYRHVCVGQLIPKLDQNARRTPPPGMSWLYSRLPRNETVADRTRWLRAIPGGGALHDYIEPPHTRATRLAQWRRNSALIVDLAMPAGGSAKKVALVNYHSPCCLDKQWYYAPVDAPAYLQSAPDVGTAVRRIHLAALLRAAAACSNKYVVGLDSNLDRDSVSQVLACAGTTAQVATRMAVTNSTVSARTPQGFAMEIDYIICDGGRVVPVTPVTAERLGLEQHSHLNLAMLCSPDEIAAQDVGFWPDEANPSDHIPVFTEWTPV